MNAEADGDTLTWGALCQLEPRLLELEKRCRSYKRKRGEPFCANAVWYGHGKHTGIKPVLVQLVGWGAKSAPAPLPTEEAYDLAYEYLYALLPDCRDCLCG